MDKEGKSEKPNSRDQSDNDDVEDDEIRSSELDKHGLFTTYWDRTQSSASPSSSEWSVGSFREYVSESYRSSTSGIGSNYDSPEKSPSLNEDGWSVGSLSKHVSESYGSSTSGIVSSYDSPVEKPSLNEDEEVSSEDKDAEHSDVDEWCLIFKKDERESSCHKDDASVVVELNSSDFEKYIAKAGNGREEGIEFDLKQLKAVSPELLLLLEDLGEKEKPAEDPKIVDYWDYEKDQKFVENSDEEKKEENWESEDEEEHPIWYDEEIDSNWENEEGDWEKEDQQEEIKEDPEEFYDPVSFFLAIN